MNAGMMHSLLVAWLVYFVAIASPGPATLAISGTAMSRGRSAGVALAAGVSTGSFVWANLAALGMSAILARFAEVLIAFKIAGALYLFWMAYRSIRSAMRPADPAAAVDEGKSGTARSYYLTGLGIHLTNPKAIFTWLSLVSLALPPEASPSVIALFVAVAMVISVTTMAAIAILFSTPFMARAYRKARRSLEGCMAAFFTLAGVKLLSTI